MKLDAVLRGEGDVGEDVRLGVVHACAQLGPPRPQLVGDAPPGPDRGGMLVLEEGLADRGCHHGLLALGHVGEGVPHEVHAAPLP